MTKTSAWRGFFADLVCRIYFHRVTVLNPGKIPCQGPVLYLGLHRNGAADGFVYHRVLPKAVFQISSRLRRGLLGRLFFTGIELGRTPDNTQALIRCLEHLHAGGELFVFPEGASSLGPRHLPFKSGAAQLALSAIENRIPIFIVPVGIFYEDPAAFRANAEVVIGDPINTELPEGSQLSRLREMKRRIAEALEELGTNVASEGYQDMLQRLAYVGTLGTPRSYWRNLKAFEGGAPPTVLKAWDELKPELDRCGVWYHQGVPLCPLSKTWVYTVALVGVAPIVLWALLANLPPVLAGWWAGRRSADSGDPVSLRRILVGVPALLLWFLFLALAAFELGGFWLALAYVWLTLLGLGLYYRAKKLAVAVHNGLSHPELTERIMSFRWLVLEHLPYA